MSPRLAPWTPTLWSGLSWLTETLPVPSQDSRQLRSCTGEFSVTPCLSSQESSSPDRSGGRPRTPELRLTVNGNSPCRRDCPEEQLPPLQPGDQVRVQDQYGNSPRQWSKTGVVVEVEGFNSYLISLDGSRQMTKRNRKFLRKISPHPDSYKHSESTEPPPVTVRPPPPPVTPPRTTRSAPAQPATSATPPPLPTPSLPDNTPTVPPLIIRRSGDEYSVVPGPLHQVAPLQTPQYNSWMPWPLSTLPPTTPAGPAHYVIPAPWPWSPAYQHQATRL